MTRLSHPLCSFTPRVLLKRPMSKVLKTVGGATMSIRTNLQAIHGADEMDSVGELVGEFVVSLDVLLN